MERLALFVSDPYACVYLPGETARLEYELVLEATAGDYQRRMDQGWRRFGRAWFHPVCASCSRCMALRVPVATFRPSRSQSRARKINEGEVELRIDTPSVTAEKLRLYDRYHLHQAGAKGWPLHDPKDPRSYIESFVDNPIPTEEWCYYLEGRLAGVGYVDVVPGGMSAIYFYYDPDLKGRSIGTWNVLSVIDQVRARGLSYAYLGYYVEGSGSVSYKANFAPNQLLHPDGRWRDFRP